MDSYKEKAPSAVEDSLCWRTSNGICARQELVIFCVIMVKEIGQIVKNSIYDAGSWVEDIYYHYDALGNVMGYTDSNANATTYEMDAFGNRIENSSTWETMTSIGPKEHLTGKMLDDDTGLYYFHARWYDPQVGRFVGRDPARESDGSQYMFALDNPMLLVDPTGAMTGGIPPNFYKTKPGEANPCCSESEAIEDWHRIVMALFGQYPREEHWPPVLEPSSRGWNTVPPSAWD